MMRCHELQYILNERKVPWERNGDCYYRDDDGDLVPFDYVEADEDGNLIVSRRKEEDDESG